MTPHTLRHTWATLAARAGVDLYAIAGVLGDTLSTVEKNYLHHAPDHLRGAINFKVQKAA
jgi:integrase